jgi:hypothetical protein
VYSLTYLYRVVDVDVDVDIDVDVDVDIMTFWLMQILCMQALIRQMPENIAEAVAWRSAELRGEDDHIRSTGATLRKFEYAPVGMGMTCAEFLQKDSSINVLELMGDLPGGDNTMDSDRVLITRMEQYKQRATVNGDIVGPV